MQNQMPTEDSDQEETSDDEQHDAPRVAQWVGEDELDDEDLPLDEMGNEAERSDLKHLKRDLSELPLGALVKAHKAVRMTQQDFGSDKNDSSDSDEESEPEDLVGKPVGIKAPTLKPRRSIERRSNKHAPMEVTSKKPVPRRRQVVEVHSVRPRDPRFSDLSGKLSVDRFRTNYSFLPDLHTGELLTLKQSLARARKLLMSSPRHLRQEREEEVSRLELAVKRAESTVNKEKRELAELQAFAKLKRDEKEKRKAGKKSWWLKDADKKAIRVRARMDAIASSGGKRAVKQAIEKRQRKIGQKEKKSRPFAPQRTSGQKRMRDDGASHEGRKVRPRLKQ